MDVPELFLGLLLVALLLLVSVYIYLAWFGPDRFRTLMLPPEWLQKLLGKSLRFLWSEGESEYVLWNVRFLGPLVAAILLAFLIAMARHSLGF